MLAVLLPASARPVSAQAATCGEAIAQAASEPAVTVASADQKVKISYSDMTTAIRTTLWSHRYSDAERVMGIVIDKLAGAANTHGGINWDDLATPMLEYKKRVEDSFPSTRSAFRNGIPYDDLIHTMLDVALDMPELKPYVVFAWDALYTAPNPGYLFQDNASLIAGSIARYEFPQRMPELTHEMISKASDCAKIDPEFAEFFDRLWGKDRVGSIQDGAEKILADNPDLPIPTEIRNGIQADGTVEVSLNDLKAMSEAEFAKLHTTIDDIQTTVKDIDERQKVITDYLANQLEKEKTQAEAKKKAEEYQLKIDAAKAGISIISTIAGQIDPKVGKQIGAVGNATVTVADSLNKWVKATAGLTTLNKIFSLSSVVATGNMLGAVMSVISIFGPSEPPPEQLILEEIGRLREQIDQVRTEMHDRFDRIDQGLNLIYTDMHARFNQIDIQLGKINGNILEIQQALVTLDTKLSRIERNNFELLNTLARRPLLEAINGGLGYEERTGAPMPKAEFNAFENTLHSHATIFAFDPLNAGPTQRDYSDGGLFTELSAYPLDANLNYLNGWLQVNGLPAITNKPLPSPRDWLFVSRAYTQLGLENPAYMREVNPQRHATIEEIGVELEQATQKLSTQLTQAGPLGNSVLFSTVITHYQSKLDSLDSSIQALESAFLNDVRTNQLQRSEPFDLYGGIDQPLSYLTPELTTATCGNPDGHGSYPAPANLRSLIPHFDRLNLADYLKLGKLKVCISDLWTDIEEICVEPDPEQPDKPTGCYPYKARHLSYVTVAFDSVPILWLTIDEGELSIPRTGPDYKFTRNHWNSYKPMFEAFTAGETSLEAVAAVSAQLEAALGGYQQALYGQVLTEMSQGALKPLVTELGGSKALLDATTTLGLPRAVQADEFLHALLYGNQQLVDDSQIRQSYALRLAQPITGTNLLVNPRLVMQQAADDRRAALAEIVNEYLDAITAKEHVEAPDYIAGTRRALDLSMRIAQIETPGGDAIAGLQASSNSPTVLGSPTTFAASVSAGANVTFAWDFGDSGTGTGATPSHTYAQAGIYLVRVTASNSLGQQTAETIVQVHAPDPNAVPVAGLTASQDGPTALGAPTRFAANVTAGSNVSFAWDFGDGKAGVGPTPSHTYSAPGVYTVRVTASNSVSQATVAMQVVVEPAVPGQATSQVYLPSIAP
jgi:hypothetical protein